jgi:hypothetical protein
MTNRDEFFRLGSVSLGWAVAFVMIGLLLPSTASAQEDNRVGLVITHDDGSNIQQCVSFSESEISGLQVLERSSLDLNYDAGNAMGASICRIDGEGCSFPQDDCFCQCLEPPCRYWSYWTLGEADWNYSSIGASNHSVSDKDVEAWVWSEGTINGNAERQPPDGLTFDQICGGAKNADIIVQFDDSDAVIRSIEFNDEISGLGALVLSGLDVVTTTTGFGPAVCSIEGVGCPADDCFCQSSYWGYNYWDDDVWKGYAAGASSSVISQTGAVEGWLWGEFGDVMSPATNAQAAQNALTYIRSTQVITDGGFGTRSSSFEAALAIGANREDASDWSVMDESSANSSSLAGYILANGSIYAAEDAAASGKVTVSSASTSICQPASFAAPATYYDAALGAYSVHNGFNAWAILGALAAGEDVPPKAVQTLAGAQMSSGGWEWMAGFGADTNTTSLAIQALIGTGESITSTELISGLAFLKIAQNKDGGFTYDPVSTFGTDSDANSTAYSIQAIWAAGQNPTGPDWTSTNDKTPIDFLLSLQLSDGSFEWQPDTGTNISSTRQAIPALLGSHFPMSGSLEMCDTIYLPRFVVQ